ncbi:MAG: hypothetical protein A2X40_04315 [Elusimicrobia bacterium GWC2_65_9]|nr:MAG: hypothetical protein A2X37_03145 [Elusimicrobia bacterium GWA2_66_18]OGR70362.1 MAG: hypothetical protein A2X40_04315 [Elusimicrobia bacterium GWC2_65_9]
MTKKLMRTAKHPASGFKLIELMVAALVLGILAAIAVPQYYKIVEKGKFAESMEWLSGLNGAQDRYLARNSVYFGGTITPTSFDANLGNMANFTAGAVTAATNISWTITLTRKAPCPAAYGCYTLTYTSPPSTLICSQSDCTDDLL